MKLKMFSLLTLMATSPVLSIDSANPLTITIVTDYLDAVFDPPEGSLNQWSTDGSNTKVLSFTKVYNLFFVDVNSAHSIEFDVRREVWGIQYEHHCKVSVVAEPGVELVYIKFTGLDDFIVDEHADTVTLDCPKVPTSMGM